MFKMNQGFAQLAFLLSIALLVACGSEAPEPGGDVDAGIVDDPGVDDDPELVGAGGRSLVGDWPNIDLPYSENTKMLNFDMLRNEVFRVTNRSWVQGGIDQWEAYRSILGGADFVESWSYDTTPNQQKILTIRRMALRVCQQTVNQEAGNDERLVFSVVDPGLAIDVEASQVTEQVSALYQRFFRDEPSDGELSDSLALLGDVQTLENQRQAWRGLCAAYMSSMRFLTY